MMDVIFARSPGSWSRGQSAALVILVAAAATIGGAYIFEYGLGYIPCALCLMQRKPYYIGMALALVTQRSWYISCEPASISRCGASALQL